jgi:hypothetical protein
MSVLLLLLVGFLVVIISAFEADPGGCFCRLLSCLDAHRSLRAALIASGWGRERGLKANKIAFVRGSQAEGRLGLRGLVTTAPVKVCSFISSDRSSPLSCCAQKGEHLIYAPKEMVLHIGRLKGAMPQSRGS